MKTHHVLQASCFALLMFAGSSAFAKPEKKYVDKLNAFFVAWNQKDVEAIVGFFADDAVYNNVPFPTPARGKAEIRALLQAYLPLFGVVELGAYEMIADGDKIAVERVDTFEVLSTHKTAVFPTCGVFYFTKDLKIARWNDYFDARTYERQSGMPLPQ